ncbi:MAG: NADH-quinone oxidoreductase subunit K [Elusimicrobia bacterium]|nr:NADH-quinone oxidoreductase subunit K [Elusimicrobiota bacterium]
MNAEFAAWTTASALFALGAAFLLLRRQLVAMVVGIELMVNAANILIVFHAARRADPQGLAVALLALAAAAAEVVVGFALILSMRHDENAAPETPHLHPPGPAQDDPPPYPGVLRGRRRSRAGPARRRARRGLLVRAALHLGLCGRGAGAFRPAARPPVRLRALHGRRRGLPHPHLRRRLHAP